MKGKAGLVIGLSVGYVLGTRAGRERYEQMKTQWLKIWNLDPVQRQVIRAETFAKSAVMTVPGVLWEGAKRVNKAVAEKQQDGSAKGATGDVRKIVRDTAEELGDAVEIAADEASRAASEASKAPKTDGK